jgi:hypothetical protein
VGQQGAGRSAAKPAAVGSQTAKRSAAKRAAVGRQPAKRSAAKRRSVEREATQWTAAKSQSQTAREALMVWHLVLMKPRADLSADDRQSLVDAFNHAVREIPTVRDVQIGRRVIHGAAYEMAAPNSADYVASIAFDDLAGLQTYLGHPAHEALAARFYQSLSSALIYDFEMDGMIADGRTVKTEA